MVVNLLESVLHRCLGGCWKLKIVQKLKDLHTQRAVPQNQQMWWDLWSVKWNEICSESNFSWHQLVWKCLIWTGCCYRLCCSDTWAHLGTCQIMSPVLTPSLDFVASKPLLVFVFQHIIRGNRPIKAEMAHQLYVLQVLTFNLLEERMMTKMDPNDQVKIHRIINLLAC